MTIVVVMSTYAVDVARERCAIATLNSLVEHFEFQPPVGLRLHVADDGSPNPYFIDKLFDISNRAGWSPPTCSNSERHGIGGSLNLAMSYVKHDDLWLYNTDDWILTRPYDLTRAVKLLTEHSYDYVRLLPAHPNLYCKTRFNTDIGWWLDLNPQEGFAFATRPFLATKEFYNKVGPFNEGLNAYETERLYAERVVRQQGNIKLAIDVDLHGPWYHVGDVSPVGKIDPRAAVAV